MKRLITTWIIALLVIPTTLLADNYTQLWKKVNEARDKDLPKTQIALLQSIIDKATAEQEYGHLLKAETMMVTTWYALSTDSLQPQTDRLMAKAEQAAQLDYPLSALYYATLGKLYQEVHPYDASYKTLSDSCFDKALAHPALLAGQKATNYAPYIVNGRDSRIFNNDLLSLIGYAAEDYQTMHQYYVTTPNRQAAVITALDMVNKQAGRSGEMYVYTLKKSHYAVTLDSLINEYEDLQECGEVAIARHELMKKCKDVSTKELMDYANWALGRWGKWSRANVLRNAIKDMTNPQVTAEIKNNKVDTYQPVMIETKCRNINRLNVKVTPLSVGGDTKWSPDNNADYAQLLKTVKAPAVLNTSISYRGQPDYEECKDSICIGTLAKGVYLVEISTDNKNVQPKRQLLHVSNLTVVNQKLPGNMVRFVVVDNKSGKPVPHAKLAISTTNTDKNVVVECDEKGEIMYKQNKGSISFVRPYTADDNAAPAASAWNNFYYNDNKTSLNMVNVFTDRSIYRPGQTVHATVLLSNIKQGTTQTVMEGKTLKLALRDANHKMVSETTVTTDSYGTAAANFALPTATLTGNFCISVSGEGNTQAFFKVEEYKRPTFQIVFPEINQRYHEGDTLEITAHAKTFAGVPVQNAMVKYTVNRKQSLWWRNWNMQSPSTDDDYPIEAKGYTHEDGSFKIVMPMLLPESNRDNDGAKPKYTCPQFYNIVADVYITDQAGETQHGTLSLPIGNKPTVLSCDLPEKTVSDSLNTIRFSLKNFAGRDIDDVVNYYIDNPQNSFSAQTNTIVPINWHSLGLLTSGKHRLVAVCGNDTLRQDFITFSMADKKPCINTDDWFYVSSTQFPSDGSPVYLQVGSSAPDTHILYTAISGDSIIANSCNYLNNEVVTHKIVYDESYGNGLLVNVAWVKNGKVYTHSAELRKPLPDKKLRMAWTTFRDRLTPGQQEEWTLSISQPDGTPAEAQLIATLYDASLDKIAPHQWRNQDPRWLNMPSASWRTDHGHALWFESKANIKYFNVQPLSYNYMDVSLPYGNYFWAYGSTPMRNGKFASKQRLLNVAVTEAACDLSASPTKSAAPKVAGQGGQMKDQTAGNEETAAQEHTGGNSNALRENLNETAFFYPALTTNAKGEVNIKFTLPESVTTWRFMGYAHDKTMNSALLTGEAVASKAVMVQPNMPRFVRVGDKAHISSRVFNTTDKPLKGTACLQLIDPNTERVVTEKKTTFALNANGTTAVDFSFSANDTYPLLICRITATGNGFSDGEQHYLPVLSDEELVTNTQPFTLHEQGTTTLKLNQLFAADGRNKKLTIEYTNNPAWLMIQALPYISEMKDDNAISLATTYYTNSLGAYIMQQSPQIKTVFEQWKREQPTTSLTSRLAQNQELKDIVLNETPWVNDADKEEAQQQRMANYFEASTLNHTTSVALDKLTQLQGSDGSWRWWKGMSQGSPHLTASITEMLVRLNHITGQGKATAPIIDKALRYLGDMMVKTVNDIKKAKKAGKPYDFDQNLALQYLYISALDGQKPSAAQQEAANYLLNHLKLQQSSLTLYGKSLMAVVLAQHGDKSTAEQYLKSLEEYTVGNEEMGLYYDSRRAAYSWCNYRIPTQVAAIEAMQMINAKGYANTIDGMKRWLLQQKRVQGWDTPLNSINAIHAFINGNTQVLAQGEVAEMAIDGKRIDMPKTTAGLGYVKTAVDDKHPDQLTVNKRNEGTSWGAVYAQSLQKADQIEAAASGLSIKREVVSPDGSPMGTLRVGDRVKVRLTIKADRDYDFVQVKDKRAACLEPATPLSGYNNGYYCTAKDYATSYYFTRMTKGTHTIETTYYVDRAGSYDTGICTVQCAYAPEYAARANTVRLTVNE